MNKAILDYKDIKEELELDIFGINFRIIMNEQKFKDLKYKMNKLKYENDKNVVIKESINELLGNNAYTQIKNKYESDNNKTIGDLVWIKIVYFIYEEVNKYFKENKIKISGQTYQNRSQGRSNRYSRNNYNRYRRY